MQSPSPRTVTTLTTLLSRSVTYEKPSSAARAPAIDARAPSSGNPAARNPPNTTIMMTRLDREGDLLPGPQVPRDLAGDLVGEARTLPVGEPHPARGGRPRRAAR